MCAPQSAHSKETHALGRVGIPTEIKKPISKYGEEREKDGKKYKTGVPPVVSGARYSNKYLGTKYVQRTKPKWIYVKRVPLGYPDTKVIVFDKQIPEGFTPDYELINKGIFEMKLAEIFKAAGFGKFPILNPKTKSLNTWFK